MGDGDTAEDAEKEDVSFLDQKNRLKRWNFHRF